MPSAVRPIIAPLLHLHTVVAVLLGVLRLAILPRYWRRTVRGALARHIVNIGVDALPLTLLAAIAGGIVVVFQTQSWLIRIGQTQWIGPAIITIIFQNLAPLTSLLVVIARSVGELATELAAMRASGELRLLDAQGIDPLVFLVFPRVAAVTVAVACLTVWYIVVALFSGFAFAVVVNAPIGNWFTFSDLILRTITPTDVAAVIAGTLVPAVLIGTICCVVGLTSTGSLAQSPRAGRKAVVQSLATAFAILALVNVVRYL